LLACDGGSIRKEPRTTTTVSGEADMQEPLSGEDVIGGEPVGSHHRPVQFSEGRVCAEPGCTTRLSIYNGDEYCALHGALPHSTEHTRGRRVRRLNGDAAA
jgi:hypothetical protein